MVVEVLRAGVVVMGLAIVACGSETPCPPFGKAPVLVSVTDAVNGAEICDAAVTITSSTGSQHFSACPYAGGTGPNPFTVTVEKDGYATVTIEGVTVERPDNQCPGQTKVPIKLDPAM